MSSRPPAAEEALVREALLALGGARPGLRAAARAVRDWERVLAVARAGSVAESVFAGLSLHGVDAEVPEPARAALSAAHAAAVARNALLLGEAAGAQAALAAEGIASVVLKGPALLVAHYPDIGARHVGDVDLLVRRADAARGDRVLRAWGARGEPVMGYDGVPEDLPGHGHHLPLLWTARGVALELHVAEPGDPDGDTEALLARSRVVAWQGRSLRVPAAADLVTGACLHVVEHHQAQAIYLPRLLGDLAVVVGAGTVGWDEVRGRVPRGHAQAVATARRLLERGPPGVVEGWWHGLRVRLGSWRALFAARARARQGIARVFFPDRRFMARRYGVGERSPLLPLLYAWRPVGAAWSLITGR